MSSSITDISLKLAAFSGPAFIARSGLRLVSACTTDEERSQKIKKLGGINPTKMAALEAVIGSALTYVAYDHGMYVGLRDFLTTPIDRLPVRDILGAGLGSLGLGLFFKGVKRTCYLLTDEKIANSELAPELKVSAAKNVIMGLALISLGVYSLQQGRFFI